MYGVDFLDSGNNRQMNEGVNQLLIQMWAWKRTRQQIEPDDVINFIVQFGLSSTFNAKYLRDNNKSTLPEIPKNHFSE